MPYNIKLTPAAIQDIEEAFNWYNKQVTGLGYRFVNCIDERLEALAITPKSGSIRYDDVRCSLIKVFPYIIHYSADDVTQVITVYRVFHANRKSLWEKK